MSNCIISDRPKDKDGYPSVTHEGKKTRQHRLVFFLKHGFWPPVARDERTGTKLNLRKVMNGELDFRDL